MFATGRVAMENRSSTRGAPERGLRAPMLSCWRVRGARTKGVSTLSPEISPCWGSARRRLGDVVQVLPRRRYARARHPIAAANQSKIGMLTGEQCRAAAFELLAETVVLGQAFGELFSDDFAPANMLCRARGVPRCPERRRTGCDNPQFHTRNLDAGTGGRGFADIVDGFRHIAAGQGRSRLPFIGQCLPGTLVGLFRQRTKAFGARQSPGVIAHRDQ